MLLITKGETKFWYLTLTEKTTISNPYYLFSFIHRQTLKTYYFLLNDISSFKERYNKFSINETAFNFYEGEYKYIIYAQTSSSNLNPNLANQMVETGLLKVELSNNTTTTYQPILNEKIHQI